VLLRTKVCARRRINSTSESIAEKVERALESLQNYALEWRKTQIGGRLHALEMSIRLGPDECEALGFEFS